MNDQFLLSILFVLFAYLFIVSIRLILLNFHASYGSSPGFDKDLKIKHLLLAIVYDNFILITEWNPLVRVQLINVRARSYDD